jgi:parallel beta-helix repeat protein
MSGKLVLIMILTAVTAMLVVAPNLRIISASPYVDVDVETAYNMIMNGSYPDLVVLDVRTQSEHDSGHIYSAVWIPVTELEARIGELENHKDHEIIVYCLSGGRSVTASGTLDSYNFTKVYNMLGGISAWQSEGYPVWIATVHNVNTTFNYDTIQAAIDASQTLEGHTIFVEEGTYYEHVVVNKTLFLIGENRGNTVIDGNMSGISVSIWSDNVTVSGFTIRNGDDFGVAIHFSNSCVISDNIITNNQIDGVIILGNHNLITDNIITNNHQGINISLIAGGNNTISGNLITSNFHVGVTIAYTSYDNKIFHNNFVNNPIQAAATLSNTWDDGYPSGGNYWSNYDGIDLNSGPYQNETGNDGIGDEPYLGILDENNQDNYPLMGMFSNFNTSLGYYVNVISNSTIDDFEYFEYNSTIKICVSNMTTNQTCGFCRVTVPHALMNVTNISVIIDDELTPLLYHNYALYDNDTHRWIYFAYPHSIHEIVIIPEFPSLIILSLFMIATLVTAIVYRRKHTI